MNKFIACSLVFASAFSSIVHTMEEQDGKQKTCQYILDSGIPNYLKRQALWAIKDPALTKPFEEKINKDQEFIETAENYKERGVYSVLNALLKAKVDKIKDNFSLFDFCFAFNNQPIHGVTTYWTYLLHQAIKYYDVEEVKQLVETHGDTIIASSGHGSTTLPYAKSLKYYLKKQEKPNQAHLGAIKQIINFIEDHGGDIAYLKSTPQGTLLSILHRKGATKEERKNLLKRLRRVEKSVPFSPNNLEQIKLACTKLAQGHSPEEVVEFIKKFNEDVESYKNIFKFCYGNKDTHEPKYPHDEGVLIKKMLLAEKSREEILNAAENFIRIIPMLNTPDEKQLMYRMLVKKMPYEQIITALDQYRFVLEKERSLLSLGGRCTKKLLKKMLYGEKQTDTIIAALKHFNCIQDDYDKKNEHLDAAEKKIIYNELMVGKSYEEVVPQLALAQAK